jgi:hypothetical protein
LEKGSPLAASNAKKKLSVGIRKAKNTTLLKQKISPELVDSLISGPIFTTISGYGAFVKEMTTYPSSFSIFAILFYNASWEHCLSVKYITIITDLLQEEVLYFHRTVVLTT